MLTVAPCRINTHLKGWHNSCKETSIRGGRTNRADLATVGLMSYLSYSFCMCPDESIVHLHDPVNEKDGMEAERSGSAAQIMKLPREPFQAMKNNGKISHSSLCLQQVIIQPLGFHGSCLRGIAAFPEKK